MSSLTPQDGAYLSPVANVIFIDSYMEGASDVGIPIRLEAWQVTSRTRL